MNMRTNDGSFCEAKLRQLYCQATERQAVYTATNMAKEVLIVNCDGTYPLDSVGTLFQRVSEDHDIIVEQKTFQLSQLKALSEEVRQRRLLCGVFVVNAYESRLSINEDKAGIGYAVLYRALRDAAQGRALVVIGGDDRYKDGEQDKSVLSTWAYHKVAAQFDDTYLDGRRGFVFSWDEQHNPVHEEALGSYLRAITTGQPGLENTFTPTRPRRSLPSLEVRQPPRTSTDGTLSQAPPTTTAPGFHKEDQSERQNRERHNAKHTDKKRATAPYVTQVSYTDKQKRWIQEKLRERENQAKEEDKDRNIKFVGYLLEGKLVPGFGTFLGDLPPDLPSYMKSEFVNKSANMKMAAAIVFDDRTAKNCLTVRDLNKDDRGYWGRFVKWVTSSK